jgi:hypothetical protein
MKASSTALTSLEDEQYVHLYAHEHGRIVQTVTVKWGNLKENFLITKFSWSIVDKRHIFVHVLAFDQLLADAGNFYIGECIPVIVRNGNYSYSEEITLEEMDSIQRNQGIITEHNGVVIIPETEFARVRQVYGKR